MKLLLILLALTILTSCASEISKERKAELKKERQERFLKRHSSDR